MDLSQLWGAAIGVALTLAAQGLVAIAVYLRETRAGEFSGPWYGVLAAGGGKPERHEFMRIRVRRNSFKARVRRINPSDEAGRTWRMRGYVHGNVLIASFHTTSPRTDPSSYGAIVLHRDPRRKDAIVWRGYYERPDSNSLSEVMEYRVERYPLKWQRDKPE